MPAGSQGAKPIPSLGRTFFSLPRKRRRYNEDVFLEPYKPAALYLAGGGGRVYTNRWAGDVATGITFGKRSNYAFPCFM